MNKISCNKCNTPSKEFEGNTSNVGNVMKGTGYESVICSDGKVYWLCKDCYGKLKSLCEEVASYGNRYLHISSVIKN